MKQQERVIQIGLRNTQHAKPLFGSDCIHLCSIYRSPATFTANDPSLAWDEYTSHLTKIAPSYTQLCDQQFDKVNDYTILVQRTRPCLPIQLKNQPYPEIPCPEEITSTLLPSSRTLHQWNTLYSIQFPEKRLVEYDCGKLMVLSTFTFTHSFTPR